MPIKRGNTWSTCVRINGKRIIRVIPGCTNKQTAREHEAKLKKQAFECELYGVKNEQPILFKDFVEKEYIPNHAGDLKSYGNVKYTLKLLITAFGDIPLHKISYMMIDRYRQEVAKKAPLGVNKYVTAMHTIFEMAKFWNSKKIEGEVRWFLPTLNPADDIKKAKEKPRKRFITDDEIKSLLANAVHKKLRDMMLIAFLTGMREGEIRKLSRKDIDFAHHSIIIRDSKSENMGATNEPQAVPMCKTVREILSKYVLTHEELPFDHDFKKAYLKTERLAGLQNFHFHDIRHVFATLLYKVTVQPFTVKALLRHAPDRAMQTTAIYMAVLPEELHNSIAKLEDYFKANILNDEYLLYKALTRESA